MTTWTMGSHYITAIGVTDDAGTAIACRCGWFAIRRGRQQLLDAVREHAEEVR